MGELSKHSLLEAESLLKDIRGKTLTNEERILQSIRLAALLQKVAIESETTQEKIFQEELNEMIQDPNGKALTLSLVDQAFRSIHALRTTDQINYLIEKFGIPKYLHGINKFGIYAFQILGKHLSALFVPLLKYLIIKGTKRVIIPGEASALKAHLEKRKEEDARININHLGEAIMGEMEADKRLHEYLYDLENPEIEYISVKVSTLFSQINLLTWDETLEKIAVRYRKLIQAASLNRYVRSDGTITTKFVNLDMEEYRDLRLTVDLFKKVLSEPLLIKASAGIVLQSYLPDSMEILKELTQFAQNRSQLGGAPIKIRIVKGANLAMEKVEAALKNWPQAPYTTKGETDANFKRMVDFALQPDNMNYVHIGMGSHNIFDIAYGLVLKEERKLDHGLTFEMLEGMSTAARRVIQKISGNMLLYCPIAKKKDFNNSIAYLLRRFDENTSPENYLHVAFNLQPGSCAWQEQATLFAKSFQLSNHLSQESRRNQNRWQEFHSSCEGCEFRNEPDTDWTVALNREWAKSIIKKKPIATVPAVIQNQEISTRLTGKGIDPSLGKEFYVYHECNLDDIQNALVTASMAFKQDLQGTKNERLKLLKSIAQSLRKGRAKLIAAMIADTGKTIPEADAEVSEAVDFAEYYRHITEEIFTMQDLDFRSKGVVVVASPWNFPCSIPASGIIAALAGGNAVIFKPAPEAIYVGYELAQLFWEAGVSKSELQFLPCNDSEASLLINDKRVESVILTGGTDTARYLFTLRHGLDLMAETGGKNTIIVTALADKDLAIKDIVQSAFGYAGQKCSACSLLILEAEVYEDPHFRRQLRDAVASLKVGSAWNLETKMNPLIRPPEGALSRAVHSLEVGEEWLLKPVLDTHNPRLLSPGIKWGVRPGSFTHLHELFGPVLGVIRAENLQDAIEIANSTPYGLTAGLHSLDEREHQEWLSTIEAGNCYINRGITGAIVSRQPFGGTKASSFGKGAKVGGPNYMFQMMEIDQGSLPLERMTPPQDVAKFIEWIKPRVSKEEFKEIESSAGSYSFYWNHFFSKDSDPMRLLGQDNLLRYVSHKQLDLRVHLTDRFSDVIRVYISTMITKTPVTISVDSERAQEFKELGLPIAIESEREFLQRVSRNRFNRIRLLQMPSPYLVESLSRLGCWIKPHPVLANGRVELLHNLREVSISYDYHRYGNLGVRENEKRSPLPNPYIEHTSNKEINDGSYQNPCCRLSRT